MTLEFIQNFGVAEQQNLNKLTAELNKQHQHMTLRMSEAQSQADRQLEQLRRGTREAMAGVDALNKKIRDAPPMAVDLGDADLRDKLLDPNTGIPVSYLSNGRNSMQPSGG